MARRLIAVIDDDASFVNMIRDFLCDEGYATVACSAATQAHSFVQAHQPDLVILDLWMQRRDAGWNAFKQLRDDPATASIPLLLCSADSSLLREREDELAAHKASALEKPFDLDLLLEKVHAAVGL